MHKSGNKLVGTKYGEDSGSGWRLEVCVYAYLLMWWLVIS